MTSVLNLSTTDRTYSNITQDRSNGNSDMLDCVLPSINWRGRGGRHPTLSGVEFDRQLDKISIWLEGWDHLLRIKILEKILRESNYTQFQFLYTVTQPVLHRDFMYKARSEFPAVDFKPISTVSSREAKEKLIRWRQDNFHRIKSAYVHDDSIIQSASHTRDKAVKFPELHSFSNVAEQSRSLSGLPVKSKSSSVLSKTQKSSRLRQSTEVTKSDSWLSDGSLSKWEQYTAAAPLRFIEMPVRRHIQNEKTGSIKTPSMENKILSSDRRKRNKENTERDSSEIKLPPAAELLLHWYKDVWTDVKRNEFLHKLLLKLDPRQHYFISSFLSVKQHRDFISLLPEHLALKIFSFLSPEDLLKASMVSKTWNKFANTNDLWMSKCQEVKLEVPVPSSPIWKQVYKDNIFLRLNWNNGTCRTVDLRGHTNSVVTVTFDKTRIASGSLDKTIKVWDIKTGQLQNTLKGHNRGVWSLNFFTKHLLISGSTDCMIKVWNLRTGTAVKTLIGHEGPVWTMVRRKVTLVTGSQDKTAKVWDIDRCVLLHTLKGHNAAVFSVDMDEDGSLVITGSADRSVRLWKTETGKCQKVIWVSQTTSIMSVSYDRGYFACSYGETICLYRVQGAKLINTYSEHYKRIESVKLKMDETGKSEGMIVSAGKDGMVKYWDINQPDKSMQSFVSTKEQINCIHFDELRIVSAAEDHRIRIWDFNF